MVQQGQGGGLAAQISYSPVIVFYLHSAIVHWAKVNYGCFLSNQLYEMARVL